MGTKNNPGEFDCYAQALPAEPMFVLLARDPEFNALVYEWATRRAAAIRCGLRPETDWPMVFEAQACATAGEKWRKENHGVWRKSKDVPQPQNCECGFSADAFATNPCQ